MDILGQLLRGALQGESAEPSAPAGQADIGAIASQFGLSPEQANAAVGALLPAVLGGFKKAEQGGALGQVAEIAGNTTAPAADVDAGNAILGQIFGSKDVSRSVAAHASQQTGISDTILKAMLPMVAGLAAQMVTKKMGGGILGGLAGSVLASVMGGSAASAAPMPQTAGPLGGLGGLASMLDADHDGNPLDDILGMVRGR
ncbi:MAG: DUF937 domain-containing protein [Sphingomonas sp.]|uniref:DUF937 domain-containing protein n=1 Tax=Sphingomonas sp. TaxID=28214 RepID=UPI001B0A8B43|nr:DUF937 domain-containing protein [Sphingomonas sp.]MBO9622893.1 DUF937 domain-containing protein [Sphingomonas sp.]